MIDTNTIAADFKAKTSEEIKLVQTLPNRFQVLNPFMFEDGDHLVVYLKREGASWVLSDEAHTFMRLTYDMEEKDFSYGTRKRIIENVLSSFNIKNKDGELVYHIQDREFGEAIFKFIEGILKISDITYLERERIKTAFYEDLEEIVNENVPKDRYEKNFYFRDRDPDKKYISDYRISLNEKPLLIFGIHSDDKCSEATINLYVYKSWGLKFHSLGIFENVEGISIKKTAKLMDICDKNFSNLYGNKGPITVYLAGGEYPAIP